MANIVSEEMTGMFEAILTLKDVEECYKFFEDLCTINELEAMSQRLTVAKLLRKKIIYTDIVAVTGASTATISRVNRALLHGTDGYNLALDRLGKDV